MLKGNAADLMAALAKYGYSLLQPEVMPDPNDLLARMSRSNDTRVLEGFPVVLSNALDQHPPKVDLAKAEALVKSGPERERFRRLVMLSDLLFEWYAEPLSVLTKRPKWMKESELNELRQKMARNEPLSLAGGKRLSPERLKNTFFEYARSEKAEEERNDAAKTRFGENMRREFYLSLLLSPKQKDLVEKKLRGEKMNKTEREYFSRVVKKKLLALADPDLHRLAQKALQ